MNTIIKVNSLGLSEDMRKSIKHIVDQLERYNYAICNNVNARRMFPRFIPYNYRTNNIIIFEGCLIAIKPEYKIERYDEFSFRIKVK